MADEPTQKPLRLEDTYKPDICKKAHCESNIATILIAEGQASAYSLAQIKEFNTIYGYVKGAVREIKKEGTNIYNPEFNHQSKLELIQEYARRLPAVVREARPELFSALESTLDVFHELEESRLPLDQYLRKTILPGTKTFLND